MDKFVENAFAQTEDRVKDLEYKYYRDVLVERNDIIFETARIKAMKDCPEVAELATAVIAAGMRNAFVAFVGSTTQVVFHLAFQAGRQSMLEETK